MEVATTTLAPLPTPFSSIILIWSGLFGMAERGACTEGSKNEKTTYYKASSLFIRFKMKVTHIRKLTAR